MAASATFALKAVCGSGGVVCSWSLLIRRAQRAHCQAETPLIVLCRFPEPALSSHFWQHIILVFLHSGTSPVVANSIGLVDLFSFATYSAVGLSPSL